MASDAELDALLDDQAVRGAKARAALIGTAKDIMKRVDRNLRRLEVGDYNRHPHPPGKHGRVPGTMRRSIYWQVFNATNGDQQKLKFWMESVANFVELSVQGGGFGKAGWKVENGGLPAPIRRKNYTAIQIGRVNEEGRRLRRNAKPFIGGEVRLHGRMLFDRLIRHYEFIGNVVMAAAVDVRDIAKFDAAGKHRQMEGAGGILEEILRNRDNDVASLKHIGWDPKTGNF